MTMRGSRSSVRQARALPIRVGRVLVVFGALALALSVAPATSSASEAVYSDAVPVSAVGEDARFPVVEADSQGRAFVAWQQHTGSTYKIEAARIAADGEIGPVQVLASSDLSSQSQPLLALDSQGGATVVWYAASGVVKAVRVDPGGTVGSTRTISNSSYGSTYPDVAIDPQGRVTVVWQADPDGSGSGQYGIEAVRLGADGTPGPIQFISDPTIPSFQAKVAVDSQGRATVAWRNSSLSPRAVGVARLGADGAPGPPQVVPKPAGFIADLTPVVAADSQGHTSIAMGTKVNQEPVRLGSVRLNANGDFGSRQELSPAGEADNVDALDLAIDSQDRVTVAWDVRGSSESRVQSVRLSAAGVVGSAQTISLPGEFATGPRLAIDSEDRATIIWQRTAGSEIRLQAARLSENGAREGVQTLSAPGQLARTPQLAIDQRDRVTIVWSAGSGAVNQIEMAQSDGGGPLAAELAGVPIGDDRAYLNLNVANLSDEGPLNTLSYPGGPEAGLIFNTSPYASASRGALKVIDGPDPVLPDSLPASSDSDTGYVVEVQQPGIVQVRSDVEGVDPDGQRCLRHRRDRGRRDQRRSDRTPAPGVLRRRLRRPDLPGRGRGRRGLRQDDRRDPQVAAEGLQAGGPARHRRRGSPRRALWASPGHLQLPP